MPIPAQRLGQKRSQNAKHSDPPNHQRSRMEKGTSRNLTVDDIPTLVTSVFQLFATSEWTGNARSSVPATSLVPATSMCVGPVMLTHPGPEMPTLPAPVTPTQPVM